MFIAINKDKKRIHISEIEKGQKYYCPICNELLTVRQGTINAHHFAHKNNSQCIEKDGWHYDMSEWHYSWQNQFPIKNQEIVFNNNGKIHRADVFINNTIIEFQHSNISEIEFNDRNEFYKNLGYKVIWIFDVEDRNIEYEWDSYRDMRIFNWKRPIKFLANLNCEDEFLNVYLQLKESIWYKQPDYKNIIDFKDLLLEANIMKVCENDGYNMFSSDDFYSDVEFLSDYINFNYLNFDKYPYKRGIDLSKLTDEIYNYELDECYKFYGYCPYMKKELYDHTECHACNYLNIKCGRCEYRFKNLDRKSVDEIFDVKYDSDGRVIKVDISINKKRNVYNLKPMPPYKNNLLAFAKLLFGVKQARFFNTETKKVIQMSNIDINFLLKNRKCYGRLCSNRYKNATTNIYEIYGWNKNVWLLIWYTNN